MLAESAAIPNAAALFEPVLVPTHTSNSSNSGTGTPAPAAHADHTPHVPSPVDLLMHPNDDDAPPPLHEHTTSVTRSYSDLHHSAFLGYAFGLCAVRTALQQPLNLALARKQTCPVADRWSTWRILQDVYRHEGQWRGLSRGMLALSIGCALSEVIYLFLFEWGREQLPLDSSVTRDGIAGYGADVACRVVHIPLSIIAFRQMTRPHGAAVEKAAAASASTAPQLHRVQQNAWRTLKGMYAERGLSTVFAGFGTTLVVGCQWTAMWWALYGTTKDLLYATAGLHLHDGDAFASVGVGGGTAPQEGRRRWHLPAWCTSKEDNLLLNSVASVATSASTAVLFNPYLVLRTNLQVLPGATLWSAARHVYHTRGLRGFYGGLLLNVNACVLDGALASTSYEYAKLWSDRTRGG